MRAGRGASHVEDGRVVMDDELVGVVHGGAPRTVWSADALSSVVPASASAETCSVCCRREARLCCGAAPPTIDERKVVREHLRSRTRRAAASAVGVARRLRRRRHTLVTCVLLPERAVLCEQPPPRRAHAGGDGQSRRRQPSQHFALQVVEKRRVERHRRRRRRRVRRARAVGGHAARAVQDELIRERGRRALDVVVAGARARPRHDTSSSSGGGGGSASVAGCCCADALATPRSAPRCAERASNWVCSAPGCEFECAVRPRRRVVGLVGLKVSTMPPSARPTPDARARRARLEGVVVSAGSGGGGGSLLPLALRPRRCGALGRRALGRAHPRLRLKVFARRWRSLPLIAVSAHAQTPAVGGSSSSSSSAGDGGRGRRGFGRSPARWPRDGEARILVEFGRASVNFAARSSSASACATAAAAHAQTVSVGGVDSTCGSFRRTAQRCYLRACAAAGGEVHGEACVLVVRVKFFKTEVDRPAAAAIAAAGAAACGGLGLHRPPAARTSRSARSQQLSPTRSCAVLAVPSVGSDLRARSSCEIAGTMPKSQAEIYAEIAANARRRLSVMSPEGAKPRPPAAPPPARPPPPAAAPPAAPPRRAAARCAASRRGAARRAAADRADEEVDLPPQRLSEGSASSPLARSQRLSDAASSATDEEVPAEEEPEGGCARPRRELEPAPAPAVTLGGSTVLGGNSSASSGSSKATGRSARRATKGAPPAARGTPSPRPPSALPCRRRRSTRRPCAALRRSGR